MLIALLLVLGAVSLLAAWLVGSPEDQFDRRLKHARERAQKRASKHD